MSGSTLYDDDILLWSEQQAEIIRGLGATRRDLPNELDVENVAEEIESVGRSELNAVESQLQNILVHLMKIAVEQTSPAVRHWTVEIVAFQGEVRRRYARSMDQRVDMEQLWPLARELSVLGVEDRDKVQDILPEHSPFALADLLGKPLDVFALVKNIRAPVASES